MNKENFMDDIYIREAAIEELQSFCVPRDYLNNDLFIRGIREQKEWAAKTKARVLMAFSGSTPVGQVLFVNNTYTQCTEIRCIFILELSFRRRRTGTKLFRQLCQVLKEPGLSGEDQIAIVADAFETPEGDQQRFFYLSMGFTPLFETGTNLLYFPLRKLSEAEFKKIIDFYKSPPVTDNCQAKEGEALIRYEPFCPWAYYLSVETEKTLKKIDRSLRVAIHRCLSAENGVPAGLGCRGVLVNGQDVKNFVLLGERFECEVRRLISGPEEVINETKKGM